MDFNSKIELIVESGITSFVVLNYFMKFAESEGQSVRELCRTEDGIDMQEYHRALRCYRILSKGTPRHTGLDLLDTKSESRPNPDGRMSTQDAIYLTPKGQSLYNNLI